MLATARSHAIEAIGTGAAHSGARADPSGRDHKPSG